MSKVFYYNRKTRELNVVEGDNVYPFGGDPKCERTINELFVLNSADISSLACVPVGEVDFSGFEVLRIEELDYAAK